MTLHIKGDHEFKNTNLEMERDKKFDVLDQYRTLQIIDRTINKKMVATIANNLLKYVLRSCIYRSMSAEVPAKIHNSQTSMIVAMMTIYVLALVNHLYNNKLFNCVTIPTNYYCYRD